MLAYLEHKKPRNWRKKVAATEELCKQKDIFRAPREGWTLDDPRRVLPPPSIASAAVVKPPSSVQQPPKKRARIAEEEEAQKPAVDDAMPIPSSFMGHRARFKVQITDDYDKRKVFFTDDWRHDVQQEGYDLSHGIPAYFDQTNSYVLHPLCACDGKTLSATPCRIRVTFLQ